MKFIDFLKSNQLNESPAVTDGKNDPFAIHVDNDVKRNGVYYKAYNAKIRSKTNLKARISFNKPLTYDPHKNDDGYINWILTTKSMKILINEFKKITNVEDALTHEIIRFNTFYEYVIYCFNCLEIGLDRQCNILENIETIEKSDKGTLIKKGDPRLKVPTFDEFKNIIIPDKYKQKSDVF